jgi:hypothetical protein
MRLLKKSDKFLLAAAFCALLMFQNACVEPIEGCLDIQATNFNPTADEDCCCIYPQVVLGLAYRAGDESFNPEMLFMDAASTEFQIRKAVFYVSDIALLRDGQVFRPADTLVVYNRNSEGVLDSTYINTNALLINRTAFSANLGTFREEGLFTGVQLRFGLENSLNYSAFDAYPARHPLAIQLDSMHTGNIQGGYYFLKIDIFLPETEELVQIRLSGEENTSLFEFPLETQTKPGFDRRVNLQIDYLKWLEGIDFIGMSSSEINQRVSQNTLNAFQFIP